VAGVGRGPNGGGSIVDDPDNEDDPSTQYFLRAQIELHRKAIQAISDYLTKAKVNKTGTTPVTRDKFTVKPAAMLEHLQRSRQRTEEELAIQRAINAERERALKAGMELAAAKKESLFSNK
jgi:hypothetical protein